MQILRDATKTTSIALILVLIITASLITVIPISGTAIPANTTAAVSTGSNVTADYGDVQQYEWPQWYGSEHWDNYNPGPAPVSADLAWRVRTLGAASGRYYPAAFNGKVFIYSSNRMIAVNGITGAIDWAFNYTLDGPITGLVPTGRGLSTGMPYKLDDDHMIAGRVCINPNTGAMHWYTTWVISPRGVNVTFSTGGGWGGGAGYSSTEKLFFTGGRAWDFSDVSKPPTILWDISTTLFGGESFDSYGPAANGTGVVLLKSGDIARGIEARTGRVLWSTQTTGGFSSYRGMYYNGMFYKGMIDDSFTAFNASTGELVWRFDEGIDYSAFACGSAAAYGMVYMMSNAGILYAFDAKTGDVVWKYRGNGWGQYQGHPIVADGKVYQTCPDAGGRDPYTGQVYGAEYVCLDAFTGKLIWKVLGLSPCGAGGEAHLIAYGNLYMTVSGDSGYLRCYGSAKSDWPMFRHDPQLSGVGQSGPINLALRWKFTTGGQVISSPSIAADKVYFGSWDQNIYCLDAFTGSLIWKFPTKIGIASSPAVVGGKVYTGCEDGNVYCLDAATGAIVWQKPVGAFLPANITNDAGYLTSSPIVSGGKLYVGSVDSKLYCLDTANGNILWSFETVKGEKRAVVTQLKSTACVVGGAVWITGSPTGPPMGMFAVNANASLYKLDANTGDLLLEIKYPYGNAQAPTTNAIFSSPLVVGDRVFIPDQCVAWYCFNATTGAQIWRYPQRYSTLIVNTAAYIEGRLIFTDGFFTICVNATNGVKLWEEYMKREVYNSATISAFGGTGTGAVANVDKRNYKVYTSNNDNFVHVINGTTLTFPANKTRRLSWYVTQSFIISSTSLCKGMAYIGSRDWSLYCFEEANQTPQLQLSIKLNVDRTQVNKTNSESVTATGTVFPVFPIPLKVTFVKPDGSRIDTDATFDSQTGTFTVLHTPDTVGKWSVVAWVGGDRIANYADSYSNSIDLNVIQYTPPETQPPPEEPAAAIPIEYVYAGVAIVVIVVVALAGYMLMKKRKK